MRIQITIFLFALCLHITAQRYECRTLSEIDTSVVDGGQLVPMFGVIVTDNETGVAGYTRLYPIELTRDRAHRDDIRKKFLSEALQYASKCPLSLSDRYPDPLLEVDMFETDTDYIGEPRNIDIIHRGECKSIVYYEVDRIFGDTVIEELRLSRLDNTGLSKSNNVDSEVLFAAANIVEYPVNALTPDERRQYIAYTVEENMSSLACPETDSALPYMDKDKLLGNIRHACVKLGDSYTDSKSGFTIIEKRKELHYKNESRDMVIMIDGKKQKNGSKLKVIKGDVLYYHDMSKSGKKYETVSRSWFMVLTGHEIEVEAMQDMKLNVLID